MKDFNYEKACCLFYTYTKNRQKEKARFIYEILDNYESCKPKSIYNCDILLSRVYNFNTIESVLTDLDCYLTKIDTQAYHSYWGFPILITCIISFCNAEE